MGFASHQTFHLRSGWLAKALDEIGQHHQDSFSEEASIRLGIGKNMVQSLKFWTRAVGFVESHGNDLDLSRFARIVKKEDPYLEDDTTWWMIHYFLVTQPDEATSWYYLFNEFGRSEFVKEELVRSISDYSATVLGRQLSESSFIKDVDCILATYVESSEQRGTPEDNIVCPLSRLGLLSQSRSGVIAKSSPGTRVPLEVIYFALKNGRQSSHLRVENLVEAPLGIGRIFNLSVDLIYTYLDRLKEAGLANFSPTAGINTVSLVHENAWDLFQGRYSSGHRGARV